MIRSVKKSGDDISISNAGEDLYPWQSPGGREVSKGRRVSEGPEEVGDASPRKKPNSRQPGLALREDRPREDPSISNAGEDLYSWQSPKGRKVSGARACRKALRWDCRGRLTWKEKITWTTAN